MTPEELKNLDQTYEMIMRGNRSASYQSGMVLCPEGIFAAKEDGLMVVFDYDHEGNLLELPEEEQERRRQLLRERLAR
jgi:hypothetical protein